MLIFAYYTMFWSVILSLLLFLLCVTFVFMRIKLGLIFVSVLARVRITPLGLMRAQSQLFNARLAEVGNKYYFLSAEYPLPITLGVIANVEVITGKRTILNYLMKPLHRGFYRALRER
ncbi:MAG: hypothetical protein COB36_03790 [Alphaproteobacteria bacterium]|nr:MAG: hypothetical protein COB36_03790 [Alphaproteobacteria bacterium]